MFPQICFGLLLAVITTINAQQVEIPNGKIQGRQEYSKRGISFYAFQQIPYGKAPIGNLRFQPPQPAEPWDGILNATYNDKICISQSTIDDPTLNETEDCLYLNVYTPRLPSENASLAVMFYIFGGGFVIGYGNFDALGPHYWMEHDVIVVTSNYRVGLMGFLSTEDTAIPGNYGLKDQQLGLKWVKDNIKYFGGDPERVIIFGQSAGAASVAYHFLSKSSEGLFRGGIALSGSALCPWGYQRNARKYAYMMATFLNSTFNENSSSDDIRELFLSLTPNELKFASYNIPLIADQIIGGYLFAPVVEPDHEGAFLTENMYTLIETGKTLRVPLVIGIVSEEQIWNAHDIDAFKEIVMGYDDNVTMFVNDDMHITDQTQREEAGKAIRSCYTDGLMQDNLGRAVKFFSDTSFGRGVLQHAKLQSNYSDVYMYQFSYYGTKPGWRPNVPGADRINHVDDFQYLWVTKNDSNLNDFPESDIITSERYRTLFTNFAKTLNPTSDYNDLLGINDWPTVKPDDFFYLNINDTLEIKKDLKGDYHPQLVAVYEKFGIKPFDTF